jgi:hypothetical protein
MVRADPAVPGPAAVTVEAQDLKSGRIVVFLEPPCEVLSGLAARLPTMLSPIVVYMVKSEKEDIVFPTALADRTPVVRQGL